MWCFVKRSYVNFIEVLHINDLRNCVRSMQHFFCNVEVAAGPLHLRQEIHLSETIVYSGWCI